MSTLVNVAIVLGLILVEALFVAAEIALISLRESQVRALKERGRRGARVAKLVSNPNRYLASVQLGVTLCALVSSAYGAVTLSEAARRGMEEHGLGSHLAGFLSFLGVILLITFVTMVLGELVPKRLALQRAEGTAQLVAGPLDVIAAGARPLIWLFSRTTDIVVRLLGGDPSARGAAISEEELRGLVAAHESLTKVERDLIDDVFAAGERAVREVMIPRTEVAFLEATMAISRAAAEARDMPHSRYPVIRGSQDDVEGFVHVRDLFTTASKARGKKVGDITREVWMLPGTKKVLPALSDMRRGGHHLAIVVDEYGGTAGIVTLEDLIEEVIGDIRDEYDTDAGPARRLQGGDVEVDGLLNLDEFEEATGVPLPEGPYETVAGFVVNRLGHLPRTGEAVEVAGVRLTVTKLDARRIERVRVGTAGEPVDDAGVSEG